MYLSMINFEKNLSDIIINEFASVLTFKQNDENSIYFPNSTWNTGRNFQLFMMLLLEAQLGIRFRYYVFWDGDLIPYFDVIDDWELPLLEYQPAVGSSIIII
eukprot:UN23541